MDMSLVPIVKILGLDLQREIKHATGELEQTSCFLSRQPQVLSRGLVEVCSPWDICES